MTKYAEIKKVKDVINQDVIKEVMTTGRRICRIYYKVINGFLVMVSSGLVVKPEIDATVDIIRQFRKDRKEKHVFNDKFIFTYTIPTLTDAV